MEGAIWLIIIIALFLWLTKGLSKKKTSSYRESSRYDQYNDEWIYSSESLQRRSPIKDVDVNTVWRHSGVGVTVAGIEIHRGLIYVGENLAAPGQPYVQDAALIRPKLKVASSNPDTYGEQMGYWPSYSEINPQSRRAYLLWLASNRDDPNTYIGYVFLYFYGLERRLIVDACQGQQAKNEVNVLIQEVDRLRRVYKKNGSFRKYATNLLDMVRLIHQQEAVLKEEPPIISYQYSPILKLQLAEAALKEIPITSRQAFAWLVGDFNTRLRTPARRCENEFYDLFKIKYHERYAEGLIVKPNKSALKFDNYRGASGTLRYANIRFNIEKEGIPDLTKLSRPVKEFRKIAEDCMNELDSYSRLLGRKAAKPGSLTAIALLPKALMRSQSSEKIKSLSSWLDQQIRDGVTVVSTDKLLDHWGDERPSTINKRDAESIATLLQNLGYLMAPDVRIHGAKPAIDRSVVLIRGSSINMNSYTPGRDFALTSLILQLGSYVSIADGFVDESERQYLHSVISENPNLSKEEKASLVAYLEWRFTEKPSLAGLKEKISKFSKDDRVSISNILLKVILADGRIDPKEIKQTEKLFVTLGLDSSSVIDQLHSGLTASPVVVARKEKEDEFTIPDPKRVGPSVFTLDEDYIKLQMASTDRVQDILGTIFEEEEPLQSNQTESARGLDERHQQLYKILITKEEWPMKNIRDHCEQLGLMFDGAIETINAWVLEQVDAPLIDLADVLYVDLELVGELS